MVLSLNLKIASKHFSYLKKQSLKKLLPNHNNSTKRSRTQQNAQLTALLLWNVELRYAWLRLRLRRRRVGYRLEPLRWIDVARRHGVSEAWVQLPVVSTRTLQLLVKRIAVWHSRAHKRLLRERLSVQRVFVPRYLCSRVEFMRGVLRERPSENTIRRTIAPRARRVEPVLCAADESTVRWIEIAMILNLPAPWYLRVNVLAEDARPRESQVPPGARWPAHFARGNVRHAMRCLKSVAFIEHKAWSVYEGT